MDTDQSANLLSSLQSEIAKYQLLIDEENQKLKKYKVRSRFLGYILFMSDMSELRFTPSAFLWTFSL